MTQIHFGRPSKMPPMSRKYHESNEKNCDCFLKQLKFTFSGIKIKPMILGGASDSRYLRRVCINACHD